MSIQMKKGTGGSLAIVVPPDGGWGWVVVFAAFYCNVVVDGIIFSFGMLMGDLVSTFHETESKITIVGSLLNGFYLIAGKITLSTIALLRYSHDEYCDGENTVKIPLGVNAIG